MYVTYDGSLTHPGCHETVTWIILNRPIFISRKQVSHIQLESENVKTIVKYIIIIVFLLLTFKPLGHALSVVKDES